MSTHVDGAPPSVSPDPDDGEPDRQSSGLDDGSQWVRAEIQRRMAANRSNRGRHARRGDAAVSPADGPAERSARREPPPSTGPHAVVPPSTGPQTVVPQTVVPRTVAPQSVAPQSVAPQSVPLPPPGFVAAGDLPENYVPRHSVRTPGPAAEPAAPISGPIPIVRPEADDAADDPARLRRAPVGGPSLPPTGMPLPVRKRRSGPGTPLHGAESPAAGPWSRPNGSIVPSEPVQRLGAPPGMLDGAEPLPSWGVPGSPGRGFAVAPAPADTAPAAGSADDGYPADDDSVDTAEDVVVIADGGLVRADAVDDTPPVGEPAGEPATAALVDDTDDTDDDVHEPPVAGRTVDDDLAEATTTVLPVVDRGAPARMVGIPVPRHRSTRTVPPRPVTPRNIPVVGTAPPEPGSTRVRVVLSERKGVARPVRTIKEVQEGTAVGELLRRDLIRSQLLVTLRFGALAAFVLGTLPAILALLPEVGRFDLRGLRVPWLLRGVLMYPFLVGVAWRYTRVADRVEQNFADHVQD